MKAPLFAIITICYNAAETIGRTLKSVDSQNFTDYEHVIIDGASTDGTQALVGQYASERRRIISEPDKGLYDAMNKGMAASTGRYLIFLNAGDKFHAADTLACIAAAIAENGAPGIVYGQTDIVDNDGRYLRPRHLSAPPELSVKSFAEGMLVCHQAFVASRSVAGDYNLKYRFSADYDWCIRCLQRSHKNVGLGTTVLIDYLEEGVTTRHFKASLKERFGIMAHYYGLVPTAMRHIKFLSRWYKRKKDGARQ